MPVTGNFTALVMPYIHKLSSCFFILKQKSTLWLYSFIQLCVTKRRSEHLDAGSIRIAQKEQLLPGAFSNHPRRPHTPFIWKFSKLATIS